MINNTNESNRKLNPNSATCGIMLYYLLFCIVTWLITSLMHSDDSHGLKFHQQLIAFLPWILLLVFTIFLTITKKDNRSVTAIRNALLFILAVWLYGYITYFFGFFSYLQLNWYYQWSMTYSYNFMSFFISELCLFWMISVVLTHYSETIPSLKKQCLCTIMLFFSIGLVHNFIYRCIQANLFPQLIQQDLASLLKFFLYSFIPNITWIHLANFILSITLISAQVRKNQSIKLFKPIVIIDKLSILQSALLFLSLLIAVPALILSLFYIYVYGIHPYIFFQYSPAPRDIMGELYYLIINYQVIFTVFFTINACCITLLWRTIQRRAPVLIYTLFACSSLYFTTMGWIKELNQSGWQSGSKTPFISFDLAMQFVFFIFTFVAYLIVIKLWRKVEVSNP